MFLSEKGHLMLLSRTKENIKIHYKLVTDVTALNFFFFFVSFKGISWFLCVGESEPQLLKELINMQKERKKELN